MKNEEKVFMAILLIIMFSMVFMSFRFSSGAKVLPLISGIFSAAMMCFLVVMAFSSRMTAWYQQLEAKTILSKVILNDAEKRREIWVVVWFSGCTILIYLLGFIIGIPLFLFLFLKLWAKESWMLSVVLSAVVLGVVYFSFIYILRVPLHEGIFLQ
jgi:hypothetical protein